MNLPIFLSNWCGDCPDRSRIPMLLYQKRHYDRFPGYHLRVPTSSKSEIFYDCQNVDSKHQMVRRQSKSSSNITRNKAKNFRRATASFLSIDSQFKLEKVSSELILRQCKTLLDTYSINLHSARADGSILSLEDLELLRRIIQSNQHYKYLSPSKIQILMTIMEKAERHYGRVEVNSVSSKESNDSKDETWNAIQEIFRRHSKTRQESTDENLPEAEKSCYEFPSTLSIPRNVCDIDEYLALTDCEQALDTDLEELIDKMSVDSLELPSEQEYVMDYSQILTVENGKCGDETGVVKTPIEKYSPSNLEATNPNSNLSSINPNSKYQRIVYEWYVFIQDIRRILGYIKEKSSVVGICMEYEIKCMTFEDLERIEKFYKLDPRPSGIELQPMSVNHIKSMPELLFDLLNPADISYLKTKSEAEKNLGDLCDKLCEIQEQHIVEAGIRKYANKPETRSLRQKHTTIKTLMTARKRVRRRKKKERFYDNISISGESDESCYKTARETLIKSEFIN